MGLCEIDHGLEQEGINSDSWVNMDHLLDLTAKEDLHDKYFKENMVVG